jgi:hypothetical protein
MLGSAPGTAFLGLFRRKKSLTKWGRLGAGGRCWLRARAQGLVPTPPKDPRRGLLALRQQNDRRSRPYDFLEPPHEISDRNTHSAARVAEFEKIEPPGPRLVLADE